MIKNLSLKNVGPAKTMELTFGNRLNLLTGDNGLGKSFLLDIVWWALTRKWPAEINPRLTAGKKAQPLELGDAKISFCFDAKSRNETYESSYLDKEQAWTGRAGRPANPGLVLYALSDGSFAVWDPARNYWRTQEGVDVQDRRPAYVFSPEEVWNGLQSGDGTWLSNGLIRDWAAWQNKNGKPFKQLKEILKALSPSKTELLEPGELTRISLDDVRDMPTLRLAYGKDVPVVFASSGMRRIIALTYFLVWAWEEHQQAANLLREQPSRQIIFLIDEVESHLHPSWQRRILPALLDVMGNLAEVQVISATHSPLVMASVEPLFDPIRDAWFDLDLVKKEVVLQQRDFEKHGDADGWLISEAFDQKSSRPLEYEDLVERAAALIDKDAPSLSQIRKMNSDLVEALGPTDDFLFRWRYICNQKGWLK